MDKLYGYTGQLLRVDLTNEKITEEKLDEETARKYLGGTGLGAKYLYEEVKAGTEWSDEDNRIIMATGPIGGTRIGGSGTFSVVTKGALTNGAVASQANGYFGAFLKFSGHDGIIIQGRARKWVYLHVHDGRAELRDASHLLGKDTWETAELIKNELGIDERGTAVASVGPAGENLVKFASIFVDKGHTASHNGVGAVMGSKKLKAIAVARGKARPDLKDGDGISAMAKKIYDDIKNDPVAMGRHYSWGTLNLVVRSAKARDGILPVKNYTTSIYDIEPEKLEKYGGPYIRSHFEPKRNPCWACQMHHCDMMKIPEGPFKGYIGEEPEYECFAAFGPAIGVTDVMATFFLANEADRLGIDANETGWTLGLVMECYEKRILSREDCDGLEMTWGNYEAAHQMIHKIAKRQGFGDILAEGAMRASRHIGGEAPNFAVHTMKGNTPRGHDHRSRWPMLFDTCVSQMSTDEGFNMKEPADVGLAVRPVLTTNNSPEDALAWNAQCKGAVQFEDCLGVCRFNTMTNLKLLAELVTMATGWDFSAEEALAAGRRIVNLLRAFNIRHGHTAEMDVPSPRYGSAPVDGPSKGKTITDYWDGLRSRYYEQMGWDRDTGKPLPDTLRHLGLEYAIPELWGR
ncbi:aldehyde ferredoxin oxidoreductase family protein [Chloroflexota bacterium]